MCSGWSALAAFILGAVITNVHWALLYWRHLRDECENPLYHRSENS